MGIEAPYVIGLVVIVAILSYGAYQSRTRNRANDPIREEATRQLHEPPTPTWRTGSRSSMRS